jgi:LruC domain-containing protein
MQPKGKTGFLKKEKSTTSGPAFRQYNMEIKIRTKTKAMKILRFILPFVAILILWSCMKPNPNEEGTKNNPRQIKNMNDLVVNPDFNWKTTQTLLVDITLPTDINVLPLTISSPDGKRVYFTGYPENESNELKTVITVPTYETKLRLSFAKEANIAGKSVPIQGNRLIFNLRKSTKSAKMVCDMTGLITYSQGGWHAPANGHNAGVLRDAHFGDVFPSGLVIGDPAHFTMTFTSAHAIAQFLPGTGPSHVLSQSYTDPANAGQAGNWAGQIAAAVMNVEFNDKGYLGSGPNKLKDLVFLNGPFQGMSVANFLTLANKALGGGGMSGFSINEIAYAAEQINLNFENGGDLNYFTCPTNSGGNGTGPTEVHSTGTLAYEDLWPWKGDYDFNDLVINYDFDIFKNINEEIRHIKATFIVYAFGASFYNGFGFELPGVPPDALLNVTGYRLKSNSIIHLRPNGLEAGQPNATVIVFDDAFDLMQHPGVGIGVNTDPSAPYVTPDTLVIEMSFMNNGVPAPGGPVTFTQLDIGNFNPFLIVNQNRGVEVHLPGYAPTALADPSLIGTGEDDGNNGPSRDYRTHTNLPWAINIPEVFAYPIEKQDITGAYNHFAEWAESDGQLYPDWYKNKPGYRNASLIYHHQ